MTPDRSPRSAVCFGIGLLAIFWMLSGLGVQAQEASMAATGAAASSSYTLTPNDQVQIEVFQEEDLRTNTLISKEGTITFPLLGTVKLAGMTQAQARDRITELLRADYLVNPQVSLSVVRFSRKRFTVLGQVQRPGSYDMPDQEGIDLLEAIAMAGGYTRIAEPSKITIKRRVGGAEQVYNVNAKNMAKKLNSERFSVLQGDTITVAESIF